MTTIDLANETGVTPKTIRQAIKLRELHATRQGRGREQNVFVIQREDADNWIKRRAEKKNATGRGHRPTVETLQRPREHHAFFPNHDDKTMVDMDPVEAWKRDALKGDQRAREQLRKPWEQGGIGLKVWWNAEVGAVI